MENFNKDTYQIIKCEYILNDFEYQKNQINIIINYHEGNTNHRNILESDLKLKQKHYLLVEYKSRYAKINKQLYYNKYNILY